MLNDFICDLRGFLNLGLSWLRNLGRGRPVAPLSAEEVLARGEPSLLDLARLLEGRSAHGRLTTLEAFLAGAGLPIQRHVYAQAEEGAVNLAVDLGTGERLLILIAHHDAVPGSPGANDNASSVAVLLALARRLLRDPPSIRVRLLFTGSEEFSYYGARQYVKTADLRGLCGVLSLELCGIGDCPVIWDVVPPLDRTPFLEGASRALEGLGLRRGETFFMEGRVPLFGSDHRAFAALGLPAFGFTMVPRDQEAALREFIFKPWRSALRMLLRRPVPFQTYHTAGDRSGDLQPAAMERALEVMQGIVKSL